MRWTCLLPFRSFELSTSLAPKEAAELLSSNLGSNSLASVFSFGLIEPDAPYSGTASPAAFSITRNISYSNSFLPVIEGILTPMPYGSNISVTMRLSRPVLIFSAVWIAAAAVFAMVAVVADALLGLAFIMPVAGIALVSWGFAPEAAKSERFLRELFPPARGLTELGPYRDAG